MVDGNFKVMFLLPSNKVASPKFVPSVKYILIGIRILDALAALSPVPKAPINERVSLIFVLASKFLPNVEIFPTVNPSSVEYKY